MSSWPFGHCPRCGSGALELHQNRRYSCEECGFVYFHNVATGAGVWILSEGKLLLLKRGKDPGRGLYTIPGGFIDPGESAEEATVRECREEIGLEIAPRQLNYLTSAANYYTYRDIPYVTCDIFFWSEVPEFTPIPDGEEATEALVITPEEIEEGMLAFPSTRTALDRLIEALDRRSASTGGREAP